MKDRIEMTYEAIDEMIGCHGKPCHAPYSQGKWDCDEEWKIYKKQVGDRYTKLQWSLFETYFKSKRKRMTTSK